MDISKDILYIGVNDHAIDLFEGQYVVPNGMAYNSYAILDEKTAEYAAAVLHGRPHFHISLLCDISPNCDCHGESDAAIIPDIGILAGFDPVALDVAACDLCNRAPRLKGTWMDDCPHGEDLFDDAHGNTHWRDAIDHAVRIGLGSAEYELIEL